MKLYSFVLAAAPIVSVGLYQEDIAVVSRQVTPENGTAIVKIGGGIPIDGSFWHSAKKPVTVRRFERMQEVEVVFLAPACMRGVIEAAKGEGGHSLRIPSYRSDDKVGYQVFNAKGKMREGAEGELELSSGSLLSISDSESIVNLAGLSADQCKIDAKNEGMLEFKGADEPFTMEYLTTGANWTPSYRLMLKGEKATLLMSGELRNYLADWAEAEVSLISGKCNITRDESRERKGFGRARNFTNASCEMKTAFAPSADGYVSAANDGLGDDIHYRSLGKVTLKRGEELTVPLGAAETDVKRLVEWTTDGLWDAVKFKNPFAFPMAVGKIEVTEEGRILGMSKCGWTNPGDETFVRIAEANSVKGKFEEQRESKGRSKMSSFGGEMMKVNNRTYSKEKVMAFFTVTNFRKEKVAMSIRRIFSGELGEMTLKPTKMREIPPKDFGVNPEQELTWEFELQAGEKREFKVEYSRWFAM